MAEEATVALATFDDGAAKIGKLLQPIIKRATHTQRKVIRNALREELVLRRAQGAFVSVIRAMFSSIPDSSYTYLQGAFDAVTKQDGSLAFRMHAIIDTLLFGNKL